MATKEKASSAFLTLSILALCFIFIPSFSVRPSHLEFYWTKREAHFMPNLSAFCRLCQYLLAKPRPWHKQTQIYFIQILGKKGRESWTVSLSPYFNCIFHHLWKYWSGDKCWLAGGVTGPESGLARTSYCKQQKSYSYKAFSYQNITNKVNWYVWVFKYPSRKQKKLNFEPIINACWQGYSLPSCELHLISRAQKQR